MKRPGSTSTTGRAPEPTGHRGYKQAIAERMYDALSEELPELFGPPTPAPGLHLTPLLVSELETLLGVSVPLSASSLYTAIERLASLKIGDIRLPFTPGQLAELQHRAAKRGRTVEAEMKAVVARIEDELFYKGS